MNSSENFRMEVLCKAFICLSITNQPLKYAKNNFEYLKDLNLADSGTMEEIDMLIGSDFYYSLVKRKVKMGRTGEPVAIKTKFGWVLNGPLNEKASQGHVTVVNKTKSHVLNLFFEPTKIPDPTKIESLETHLKKLYHRTNMFVKYSWNILMIYSWNIQKKFPMKFRGIFPNNVLGILNIGTFPECSMNILSMLHVFFLGRSKNTIVVFSSG